MGATSWVDLVCWTVWAVLWATTVGILVVFLRGDRSRGRRRCGRCWYDMGGMAGLKCPECGGVARSEREFHKTRRRMSMLVASVLCLFAAEYVRVSNSSGREVAMTRWIPSTVLAFIAPTDPFSRDELTAAVRVRSLSMWEWQRRVLWRRQLAAVPETQVQAAVVMPEVWPSGRKIPARLEWYPLSFQAELLTGDGSTGLRRHEDSTMPGEAFMSDHAWFDSKAVGRHDLQMDVILKAGSNVTRTVRVHHSVSIVEPDAYVSTPLASSELDVAMDRSLSAFVSDNREIIVVDVSPISRSTMTEIAGPGSTKWPTDFAILFDIELLDGDTVVMSRRSNPRSFLFASRPEDPVTELIRDLQTSGWRQDLLERLTLRVRSVAPTAAQAPGATRHWAGEVEMPLDEALMRR